MMLKRLLVIGVVAAVVSCNNSSAPEKKETTDSLVNQVTVLSEAEKNEGWKLLFDGATSKGWHKYGGEPAGNAWKIVDGAFYLDTSSKVDGHLTNAGDLVTDEDYENFDLKLEWKISQNGNSGIIFYVDETDTVKHKHSYDTGPEMQVLDNDGHADGKIKKHRAGDLYDLVSSSKEPVKPVGEWNEAEIKSLNGKLDLYLNGENVVSTTMWDDNWKKLIADSKFKTWEGFGAFKKGKICLQDHGNAVWYRNLRIKKL
jgi:hypothetical protein